MTNPADRRQFPRIATYLPVRVRLPRTGRYLQTLTKDVSVGGMRCMVEGQPAINDMVMMELPLYKEVMPLHTRASVAWVRPITAGQSVVGVRFGELTAAERAALTAYLEQLTPQPASSAA